MTMRIIQEHKVVWKINVISGHEWPEYTPIKKWTVCGGKWHRQSFKSEKAAEKELQSRIDFDLKFPE
jgi:hypothetical protein